jgi:hypothetical protein
MIALKGNVNFYWKLIIPVVSHGSHNYNYDDSFLKVKMVYPGKTWLSLGIAENEQGKMSHSDCVIASSSSTATLIAKNKGYNIDDGERSTVGVPLKYHIVGYDFSNIHLMNSSQQTLINATFTQTNDNTNNDETVLEFTKRIAEINAIHVTNTTTFIYAVGYDGIEDISTMHQYANSFHMEKFNNCPSQIQYHFEKKQMWQKTIFLWWIHGICGALAFTLCFPIAIITAIFREHLFPVPASSTPSSSSWIIWHTTSIWIGFGLTVITFTIAVITRFVMKASHFKTTHHKVGLALLLLSSIQVWTGYNRPPKEKRIMWSFIHRLMGVSIVSLGIFEVGDGLSIVARKYTKMPNSAPVYFAIVGSLIAIAIVLKVCLLYNNQDKRRTYTRIHTSKEEVI